MVERAAKTGTAGPSAFVCAWAPCFRLQAAAGSWPAAPAVAIAREGPLELVASANRAARQAGVHAGMAAAQALGRCPGLQLHAVDAAAEQRLSQQLRAGCNCFSPRVQILGSDTAILDFAGLAGLQGSPEALAERIQRDFAEVGLCLQVAVGAHPAAALLAARAGGRLTPQLPVELLAEVQELTHGVAAPEEVAEALALLRRWGVRTLGELAALPEQGVAARLGRLGTALQRLARGEAGGVLAPPPEPEPGLETAMQFDPPLRDLETLKAAVAHRLGELALKLEQRDLVVEAMRLDLAMERQPPAAFERRLAVPTREARALAEQLGLALDQRPPRAPIASFTLALECGQPRRIQVRMFASTPPDREKLPKLLGLLAEMFGDRVGSPRLLDTHRPQAFVMERFAPPAREEAEAGPRAVPPRPMLTLRRYRPPRPLPRVGVTVLRRAGPWRSAGGWWREPGDAGPWASDEWDAELRWREQGETMLVRLAREAKAGGWVILGRYD